MRARRDLSHPSGEEKVAADLRLDLEPGLPPVPCHLGEFNQVVLNLIINAAQVIGERVDAGRTRKGTITVSTRQVGDWVEVRVEDTGAGIPAAIRNRILTPSFTTKPQGKGTGQGLTIVQAIIVGRHGGTVDCESKPGVGGEFVVRLPLELAPAPTGAVPPAAPA